MRKTTTARNLKNDEHKKKTVNTNHAGQRGGGVSGGGRVVNTHTHTHTERERYLDGLAHILGIWPPAWPCTYSYIHIVRLAWPAATSS